MVSEKGWSVLCVGGAVRTMNKKTGQRLLITHTRAHIGVHIHAPICGHGLSSGPTDGLGSRWLRILVNPSDPSS